MPRLFFALLPASAQSVALTESVAPLIGQLQAQPVPAQNLHATLCFLGEVAEGALNDLRAAAGTARAARATLHFSKLDYWPKPGILCAVADDSENAEPVHALARELVRITQAAGLSPDPKPLRPHLTLARKVAAQNVEGMSWPGDLSVPIDLQGDRFVLMQSRRDASGSIYSAVDSWLLDI